MEHLTTLDAQEGVPTVYNRFDYQSAAYYVQYTLIITVTKNPAKQQQPPNHKSKQNKTKQKTKLTSYESGNLCSSRWTAGRKKLSLTFWYVVELG